MGDEVSIASKRWVNKLRALRQYIHGDVDQHLEKPIHVSFVHPGISDVIFNKGDNLPLDKLICVVGEVQTVAIYLPTSADGTNAFKWAEVARGNMSFAMNEEFEMSRDLYDVNIIKSPLKCRVALGHIGNTSITFITELYSPGCITPLVRSVDKSVLVDRTTRRPKRIPSAFYQKYAHLCELESPLAVTKKFQRPKSTFLAQIEVFQSHIDQYQHTNYSVYPRFATDAVHKAVLSRERNQASKDRNGTGAGDDPLKGLTLENVDFGLKYANVVYFNECLEGDIMDVYLWSEKHLQVKCSIEKQGTVCCQITLEYFPVQSQL